MINGFISKDGKSVHILHSLAFTLILFSNRTAYCNVRVFTFFTLILLPNRTAYIVIPILIPLSRSCKVLTRTQRSDFRPSPPGKSQSCSVDALILLSQSTIFQSSRDDFLSFRVEPALSSGYVSY